MSSDSGIVSGDLFVRDRRQFSGVVEGDVTVEPGGRFMLSGVVHGDLTIEREAHAEVIGVVNGDLVNHGTAIIRGLIQGDVIDPANGVTLDDGALVNGDVT